MTENSLTIIDNSAELSTVVELPADQNPALVYLASLGSENSRRAMRHALNVITDLLQPGRFVEPVHPGKLDKGKTAAQWEAHRAAYAAYRAAYSLYDTRFQYIPWHNLRFQHTSAIRARLAEQFKYTTANNALSALRGVLNAAADLGLMTADECRAACKLKVVKGKSNPAGRDVKSGELIALVEACKRDKTPAGARDAALIGILYACGLRRAEIVALDLAHYDPASGKLDIHGKGNKDRTVYATNGAKMALDAWLVVRGSQGGPLFCVINKAHRLIGRHMTTQAIYFILKARATQAGVKDFSPHDMRRTYAGDMLDRGADISTVAKLMGHASVTTTARYDRRDEETKQRAASLLHFPF